MEIAQLRNICIDSSKKYYDFLEDQNKGLEEIGVTSVEKSSTDHPIYSFTVGQRLFDTDNILIEDRLNQRKYYNYDINVIEYDRDNKLLVFKFKDPSVSLNNVPSSQLFIISDLKFLVRNVYNWFVENGLKVCLPSKNRTYRFLSGSPSIPFLESSEIYLSPSEGHINAISLSLNSPLSYVWGPPGSGKTRCVLAYAVLSCLRAGKRVGIFAPTNNALEQSMSGILETLLKSGSITDFKFLRIGTPSSNFAERFPEVCEVKGLENEIELLKRQIIIYERVLHCRRAVPVIDSAENVMAEIEVMMCNIDDYGKKATEKARLDSDLIPLRKRADSFTEKFKSFFSSDKNQYVEKADKLAQLSLALEKEIESLKNNIELHLAKIIHIKTESDKLNVIIEKINFRNISDAISNVQRLRKDTEEFLFTNEKIFEEYCNITTEAIDKLKADSLLELEVLKELTFDERLKSFDVVGMTLDAFIGRFKDISLPVDHIFLDEAGYAPLIKALTLFRNNVPLTFLGDHMQLGPVCEMDDHHLSLFLNHNIYLWAKSSLFCDSFIISSASDFFIIIRSYEPSFPLFARANLNETFRFGQNLTKILSDYVYKDFSFISSSNQDNLEIYFLDAFLKESPKIKRQSISECDAIARYIRENPSLHSDNDEKAYAILTPYRNQVALLNKKIPHARQQGRILTIHKSQGREWNTLYLSIVDSGLSGNRPFFTDSSKSTGGLYVLNTAISRAKKRLILVGDYNFWRNKKDMEKQLLCQLIKEANPCITFDPT